MGNLKDTRVYISGKISGESDYLERFENAEKFLTDIGLTAVNPAKVLAQMPENTDYETYMAIAMTILDHCDEIYMLNGWEASCGANREYGYAVGIGMPIHYEA